jgi:hypothetical protein
VITVIDCKESMQEVEEILEEERIKYTTELDN